MSGSDVGDAVRRWLELRLTARVAHHGPADPRLMQFCKEVWKTYKGRSQISMNDVYRLYGAVSQKNVIEGSGKEFCIFLGALLDLQHAGGYAVTLQLSNTFFKDSLEEFAGAAITCLRYALRSKGPCTIATDVAKKVKRLAAKDNMAEQEVQEYLLVYLMSGFYHFFKDARHRNMECSQRVYLNVKASFAVAVFTEILAKCVRAMGDKVADAKLASPFSPARFPRNGRRDTIVIYTKDQAASREVIEVIREYQKTARDYFLPEVPAMLRVIPDLVGVGEGAEPRQYADQGKDPDSGKPIVAPYINPFSGMPFVEGAASFGSLRSELIAQAFNKVAADVPAVTNEQRREGFYHLVLLNFEAAQIDVTRPYL